MVNEKSHHVVNGMENITIVKCEECKPESTHSEVISDAERGTIEPIEVEIPPDYPVTHVAEINQIPTIAEFQESVYPKHVQIDVGVEVEIDQVSARVGSTQIGVQKSQQQEACISHSVTATSVGLHIASNTLLLLRVIHGLLLSLRQCYLSADGDWACHGDCYLNQEMSHC